MAQMTGAESHTWRGTRGVIGALASIGSSLETDHTFEIIAYRSKQFLSSPRAVNLDSVRKMDLRHQGKTFNNVDKETQRVLACPHGPDPVLIGVRGVNPSAVLDAFREIEFGEPVERVMLFKTNHGTDAHLQVERKVSRLAPHQSAVVTGEVGNMPRTERGGHVFFALRDDTGSVDCAAYEQTGTLRNIVLKLVPGDAIKAAGGVRRGPQGHLTLNLEKIEILNLEREFVLLKPRCSVCGGSCESMGRDQALRCRKCKIRYSRSTVKRVELKRKLTRTVYLPPPRAHRHLTKPFSRYAIEPSLKSGSENWPPTTTHREENDAFGVANLLKSIKPASQS